MSSSKVDPFPYTPLPPAGEAKLKQWDRAIKIAAIASLVLLGATVVTIGLAQAGKIPPVSGLITFAPILPAWVAIKCMDNHRKTIADEHGIDLVTRDKFAFNREEDSSSSGSDSDSS